MVILTAILKIYIRPYILGSKHLPAEIPCTLHSAIVTKNLQLVMTAAQASHHYTGAVTARIYATPVDVIDLYAHPPGTRLGKEQFIWR